MSPSHERRENIVHVMFLCQARVVGQFELWRPGSIGVSRLCRWRCFLPGGLFDFRGILFAARTFTAEAFCPLNPLGTFDIALSAQRGIGAAHAGYGCTSCILGTGRRGREGQARDGCEDDEYFHKNIIETLRNRFHDARQIQLGIVRNRHCLKDWELQQPELGFSLRVRR